MSGLGGRNKSASGVAVGLVQLPVVDTPAQPAAQTQRICDLVGKARRNLGTMDLAAGRLRWPWEGSVQMTEGSSCGLAPPSRRCRWPEPNPLMTGAAAPTNKVA
jgi:hypothetical protein